MAYIILGNMAGNCLIFGIRVLQAANVSENDSATRGIAVGVATFACLIHAFSRRGGIWLGNFLALIKVLILSLVIVTGICAWAGAFKTKNYVDENMAVSNSFANPAEDSYGYTQAFLAVIFAWSGFDQPNYVSRPAQPSSAKLTIIARYSARSVSREKNFQGGLRSVSLSCVFFTFSLTLHM
jgi:hypothetical protein